jgi:hypothetical protein
MELFVHFVSSVASAKKSGIVQQSVFFDQRHTSCDDIDVVADCQINEAIADFFGILGQPADGL